MVKPNRQRHPLWTSRPGQGRFQRQPVIGLFQALMTFGVPNPIKTSVLEVEFVTP